MPYGEFSLLTVDVDERLGYVGQHVGVYQRHKRMGCPICVPKGESGIVGEITLMHLAVGTAILTVDIREYRRGCHGVIHGGIENATIRGIDGFYPDL